VTARARENRAIGLGCGVRDYISPINSWAEYFSIPQDLLEGDKIGQPYSAIWGATLSPSNPDPSLDGCPHQCHSRVAEKALGLRGLDAGVQRGNTLERFVTHELLKYEVSMQEFKELETPPTYSEATR